MNPAHSSSAGWRFDRRWAFALAGFIAIAIFFLWEEHRAHILGALPYLLLLACPLLHLLHHGGHGSHGRREDDTHRLRR